MWVSYLSDPHQGKSQTCYVFLRQEAMLFWKSMEQSLTITSSGHLEIIAMHETSHDCIWLQIVNGFIKGYCGFPDVPKFPKVIYIDYAAYIAQIEAGCIKGYHIKRNLLTFFFTHELIESHIELKHIRSFDNVAYLLTKSLPTTRHEQKC
jgi:hypothetical protein